MHPRYEVDKVYEVEVEGEPEDEALRRLGRGRRARRRPHRAGRRAPPGPSSLELTLHEGRKHQVKRMCEAVGHPVRRLHRREYAGLTLAGVEPGEWRELTQEEVAALRAATALAGVLRPGRAAGVREHELLHVDEAEEPSKAERRRPSTSIQAFAARPTTATATEAAISARSKVLNGSSCGRPEEAR